MKKIGILIFLASILVLTACAAPGGTTAQAATPTAGVVNTNYDNALPVPSQLALGTIMLKDTQDAVTADQAATLLPLWQAVQSMTNSASISEVEFNALVNQIQGSMEPAQLEAIANLKITQASMTSAFQTLGLNNFSGRNGSAPNGTPVARTPGVATSGRNRGDFNGPPGGFDGGGPGGFGGGGFGGGFGGLPTGTVSPSIQETAIARATQRAEFGNTMLYNAVVTFLTQAAGQ